MGPRSTSILVAAVLGAASALGACAPLPEVPGGEAAAGGAYPTLVPIERIEAQAAPALRPPDEAGAATLAARAEALRRRALALAPSGAGRHRRLIAAEPRGCCRISATIGWHRDR